MKRALLFLIFILPAYSQAMTREDFSVMEVGISTVTETIFVVTKENATDTSCTGKNYFRLPTPAPEAFLVYSAALNAMRENRKVRIQYDPNDCLKGSPKIHVFWNLNN